MATILGGITTSHIPAIGNAIQRGRENDPYWRPFFDGYIPVRAWLDDMKPDLAVVVYNDHGLNFFLDQIPTFAMGAAKEYQNCDSGWGLEEGPAALGNPEFSWHLIESLVRDEFDLTMCQEMKVDHGFMVPMSVLWPHAMEWPLQVVPLAVNTVQHPLPSPARCFKLGKALGKAIALYPEDLKVVVIGTGGMSHQLVGTVAAYGRAEDYFRFYEINPEVARLAKTRFTYLSDDPGQVEIALGDARVSLEREAPQRFDIIVLDAFSSDAVPVHLLTREALEIYLRHLAPDGVLAFHITNAYLDLRPVVNGLAEHFQMPHVLVIDERRTRKGDAAALEDALRGVETSLWVLVTRNREILEAEDVKRGANIPQTKTKPSRLWTDDESNILSLVWTR